MNIIRELHKTRPAKKMATLRLGAAKDYKIRCEALGSRKAYQVPCRVEFAPLKLWDWVGVGL